MKLWNFCWYTWPKTYSNLSPFFKNGHWSAQNDSELRSQSATRAATVRGVVWVFQLIHMTYLKNNLFGPPSSRAILVRMKMKAHLECPAHVARILAKSVEFQTPYSQYSNAINDTDAHNENLAERRTVAVWVIALHCCYQLWPQRHAYQ